METRPATKADCRAIAELALMAGEGIPAYFWHQSRKPQQELLDVGAHNAASEDANFSYRHAHLAIVNGEIAGMILAYRLPDTDQAEVLAEFPAFIRPLIELEQCAPGSFYINMLATYPAFRNRSVGTTLMGMVDTLARDAGCTESSVEVFTQNQGALRLYQRLGYEIVATRPVIPHPCHPYQGEVALLMRAVPVAQG